MLIPILASLIGANSAHAASLDQMDTLREVMRSHHVEGKNSDALLLANRLAAVTPADNSVRLSLQKELEDLTGSTHGPGDLQRGIKFITGSKTEIYCEGQGLVEMKGQHNDGAQSRLVLTQSNRKLAPGAYAQLESGSWSYELSNSYRKPMTSTLTLVSSSPHSFRVTETREGTTDNGDFTSSWAEGGKAAVSYTTHGQAFEPLPVYMALDYQLWGNDDLGYRIKFENGFEDEQQTRITGGEQDILLTSSRRVGQAMAEYKVEDSKKQAYSYKNCFPVEYEIKLKGTEAIKPSEAGQIDRKAVRDVVHKNIAQIKKCYEKALVTDPTLNGYVTLEWDVAASGMPVNAKVKSRSLAGSAPEAQRNVLMDCMVARLNSWKFPPPIPGAKAHIIYPFTLSN